jgi:hypothetical protein
MGYVHNAMAQAVSVGLLKALRNGTATDWATARLTTKSILWQGIADWPRPDIAFEDPITKATLALEFKPPNQTKREYVTGLGQMLTYLEDFEFAGLVLPEKAADGFPIALHIAGVIDRELSDRPLTLMSYGSDVDVLTVHRPLSDRPGPVFEPPGKRRRGTFWAYWRDLSNYDLLEMLRIADASPGHSFEQSYATFWDRFVVKGKAKTWEGAFRKKSKTAKMEPELINAQYSMRHCGLINGEGDLTLEGLDLLHVGKIYGADSDAFRTELARRVLLDGNHLELILWIEEQSRQIKPSKKRQSGEFLGCIDRALEKSGVIPPRGVVNGKPHFFRDESKLWNKLGLLRRKTASQYFFPGEGFRFDWRAIISSTDSLSS